MTVWHFFFIYKIRENVQYKVGLFLFIHFILFIELILSLVGDLPWGLASPTLATQAVPGISFSSKIFFQVGSSAFHFDFFLGDATNFFRRGWLSEIRYPSGLHTGLSRRLQEFNPRLWPLTTLSKHLVLLCLSGFEFSGYLVRSSTRHETTTGL